LAEGVLVAHANARFAERVSGIDKVRITPPGTESTA
jgi:hypothetical protein